MKRSANIVTALAAAALIAVLVQAVIRQREVGAVQARLAALERTAAQSLQAGSDVERLRRLFPPRADVAAFVESLSVLAREAGCGDLEFSTAAAPSAAPPGRAHQTATASPVTFYPVKLTFAGDYRAVADYLRSIQNTERFKRVVHLELRPSKNTVRTSMIIEVPAFEEGHAS